MYILIFLAIFGWIFLIPSIVDTTLPDRPDCVHRNVKIAFGAYQLYDGDLCGDDKNKPTISVSPGQREAG